MDSWGTTTIRQLSWFFLVVTTTEIMVKQLIQQLDIQKVSNKVLHKRLLNTARTHDIGDITLTLIEDWLNNKQE